MTSARARFLLVFFLLLALFEIPLLLEPVDRTLVQPFTRAIAAVSGSLLTLFANDVRVVGTMLISPCFSVNINNGCNGLEATLFLVAAVLAFPAPPKARLIGVAAGVALIQGVNLIRVLSLFLIGCYRREWFDTFHLAIWQTVVFGVAILYFATWTRRRTPQGAPQRA
jgi:exosortase H (IPTLxxWG-CTERM-specific)